MPEPHALCDLCREWVPSDDGLPPASWVEYTITRHHQGEEKEVVSILVCSSECQRRFETAAVSFSVKGRMKRDAESVGASTEEE